MALILVVDDEEVMRALVQEVLESAGHSVVASESARKALRLCNQQCFDLVITDIVMPEMDGLQLVQELQKVYVDLPILLVSGAMNPDFERVARQLGVVATLGKPWTAVELTSTVEKIFKNQRS